MNIQRTIAWAGAAASVLAGLAALTAQDRSDKPSPDQTALTKPAPDAPATAPAPDKPRRVELATQPTSGAKVQVPDPQRTTLLLFLRPDQEQSRRAIQEAKAALGEFQNVQVVAIVSGHESTQKLETFAKELPWPAAGDAEYEIIGRLNVHVWPTAILVAKDGLELGRLRGLGQSFGAHLTAYLAFASGAIDQATLQQRLTAGSVVSDSAQQMARRHLQVAQRLLEKGLIEQAGQEVDRGLALAGQDAALQLARARILLLSNQSRQAMAALDNIDPKAAHPADIHTLRGAALLALGDAQKATAELEQALKLNPNPAEAHYFLAIAYQRQGQPDKAAASFKAAFEHTPTGKLLSQVAPEQAEKK